LAVSSMSLMKKDELLASKHDLKEADWNNDEKSIKSVIKP
jgi:hypothetical protein